MLYNILKFSKMHFSTVVGVTAKKANLSSAVTANKEKNEKYKLTNCKSMVLEV